MRRDETAEETIVAGLVISCDVMLCYALQCILL